MFSALLGRRILTPPPVLTNLVSGYLQSSRNVVSGCQRRSEAFSAAVTGHQKLSEAVTGYQRNREAVSGGGKMTACQRHLDAVRGS